MATTRRRLDEANRQADGVLRAAGTELRNGRLMLGLSQAAVGEPVQMSRTKVGRIEAGARDVRVADIAKVASVLGLDLSLKLYPGDRPLRDQPQSRLIVAFRDRLGRPLALRTEVPLPIVGDRRAWDGMIIGGEEPVGLEAETRILDAQAVERRIALKQRDGGIDRVVLLVLDSAANRRAVVAATPLLTERFPLDSRSVLAALGAGRIPPGSGIVFLRPWRSRS